MQFRKLKANEIDCRVSQASAKGVALLLYKDARVDMNILDETVGPMNWIRSHSRDNANCQVGIWDEDKEQWIVKEDTGTESNTEAEKGLASDSFKRACFNWGIGRELYTAPFIWIPADKCTIKEGRNGKPACYDRFQVKQIGYNDAGEINRLEIVNRNTDAVCYSFGDPQSGWACADCGEIITDVAWPDGKTTSAQKMAMESYKKLGVCLCGKCYTGRMTNGG